MRTRVAVMLLLSLLGCATQLPSPADGGADAQPLPCGAGSSCGAGSECEFDSFAACNGAAVGRCVPMPTNGCPPQVWAPVCGCDLQTHASDCFAWLAGTPVAKQGVCP